MIDVKHYLYHRGSGKSNAAKEQGKAHYELYKATLQECKDNLSKPETHDDLAIRMRAFFPDDEGRRIYQKGLARILYPKVLPVIDKRLPQPKVLPPAYESGAKRGASSVDDVIPVIFLPCQLKPLLVAMSRTEFSMRWMRLTEAVFYAFECSRVKHPP